MSRNREGEEEQSAPAFISSSFLPEKKGKSSTIFVVVQHEPSQYQTNVLTGVSCARRMANGQRAAVCAKGLSGFTSSSFCVSKHKFLTIRCRGPRKRDEKVDKLGKLDSTNVVVSLSDF
jgi:hypothetical protein